MKTYQLRPDSKSTFSVRCRKFNVILTWLLVPLFATSVGVATRGDAVNRAPARTSIPSSQLGAKVEAQYQGDGLAIIPTAEGARLRCAFQRLEGEATREGLWLTSTVSNVVSGRFRVTAVSVGRAGPSALAAASRKSTIQPPTANIQLEETGTVQVAGQVVRFVRPGLTEEYTVSLDGVRQDFILETPPLPPQRSSLNQEPGALVVQLAVSGARVESTAFGAQLVLEHSGRRIAYGRLRATDATGKELTARIQVAGSTIVASAGSGAAREPFSAANGVGRSFRPDDEKHTPQACTPMLTVVVNDAEALYPVRIDPTFSDANWISMGGGLVGADDDVSATVVDASGNLYIGGAFKVVGDLVAKGVAKWDGNNWSALGSGMSGVVWALAVLGSNVYAGGYFTAAGDSAANHIAKWDGNNWSALGSGILGTGGEVVEVMALAVFGSNLYVGGRFAMAGGAAAMSIAKWDGNNWSAVGSGTPGTVNALVVSGGNVYAGGDFRTAGASAANYIAKWDGHSWSALGSGMNGPVNALAVSAGEMYVGGNFTTAGGKLSTYIACGYLPPLPTLSLLRSGSDVMVSWPSADTAGFALERAGTLASPASWVTNSATVTDDGINKSVILPATNGALFFRLRRP